MPCGKITGIFGTNSSGKTSLIQFLLMLKQTKDATDRAVSLELNGELVKLGTIKDVIHRHDESHPIRFSLAFELPSPLSLNDPSRGRSALVVKDSMLTMAAKIVVHQKAPVTRRLSYQLGEHIFKLAARNGDQSQFELKAEFSRGSKENFEFLRTQGRAWQLPGPVKTYAFPDQARTYFQNAGFLADLEAA